MGFLQNVGVDVLHLVETSDVIYDDIVKEDSEQQGIGFDNLVDVVMSMRGSNGCTVKDMASHQKYVTKMVTDSIKVMQDDVDIKIAKGVAKTSRDIEHLRKLWLGEEDSETDQGRRGSSSCDDDESGSGESE